MIDMRPDLQEIGLAAGKQAAGDAIERVKVESRIDSLDRSAYRFTYLFDPSGIADDDLGMLRIRIIQALRDELYARGDEHGASIVLLDREAWDRRIGD
jgi:hypothetical protein